MIAPVPTRLRATHATGSRPATYLLSLGSQHSTAKISQKCRGFCVMQSIADCRLPILLFFKICLFKQPKHTHNSNLHTRRECSGGSEAFALVVVTVYF